MAEAPPGMRVPERRADLAIWIEEGHTQFAASPMIVPADWCVMAVHIANEAARLLADESVYEDISVSELQALGLIIGQIITHKENQR